MVRGRSDTGELSLLKTRYRIAPGVGRRDDMLPADDSSTVAYHFAANQAIMDPRIAAAYVRPRTGPQSVHLWWPAMAKLQAASMHLYSLGSCAMGQTDGRIALFQNAPL